MFTESVSISCSFRACHGGLAKYNACLIIYRLSKTLYPDCGATHLDTILLWISMACQLYFTCCCVMLQFGLEKLSVLSWLSTRTPPPDRLSSQTGLL